MEVSRHENKKNKIPELYSLEVDDTVGASEAVLRIHQEIELRDKLIAHGYEDVHRRFNARRVSEEHEALFEEMLK